MRATAVLWERLRTATDLDEVERIRFALLRRLGREAVHGLLVAGLRWRPALAYVVAQASVTVREEGAVEIAFQADALERFTAMPGALEDVEAEADGILCGTEVVVVMVASD